MRGSEPVKEVQEWHPGSQSRSVSNRREVLRLLHGTGGEHCPTRLPHGHDVRVVAKNRKRVGGEGARRNVEYRRDEFGGNLEHVRQHQQETL